LLMIPPLKRATLIALEDEVPLLRSVLWHWPRLNRRLIATAYGGCLILVWLMLFSTASVILFDMCYGVIGLAAYVVVFGYRGVCSLRASGIICSSSYVRH
ncbi:MAG: hypothetical protein ACUVSL_00260, partial [Chloroflexus sp.]